ncbi:hypothetical protein DFH27DRAFT_583937 [Peziza echinospora]|nr:hypothetical protein DFH27DRAFT_583937 [Peziza echinospora]
MNGDESHELESGYTTNFGSRPNEGSQQPSSDLISDHQASGQLQQEHLQRINQPDRVQIPLGEVSGHSVEPPSSIFGGTKTYTTEVSLPPTNSVAHQHEADIYSSHIPSKSTDADFNVTVNPPVIHEQNMEQNREITTKKVTRDIHTHDHYTRVQPIIKSEYLPTKHVLLENGVEKELNQQEVEANIYPASRRVDEVIATSMRKSQYY